MSMRASVVAFVAAVAACSSGTSGGPTGTADDAGAAETPAYTFYRDVKPILDAKCVACHHDGGIAPFALTSPDDATAHMAEIASATSRRIMPPWPPGQGCTEYEGDRSLSDAQIATIGGWAAAGGPLGDAAEFVPLPAGPAIGLSRVDATVTMPEAYTPQIRPDDYRCFLLDAPSADTTYVTGFGAVPGQASIVHHVIAFLAAPGDVAMYQQLDAADAGPGWTCFGGPGGSGVPGMLGGWAPGSTGNDFASGTGVKVAAGSKIVLQVHYNTLSAPPVADRTGIQVELAPQVAKEAHVVPWTNPSWPRQKQMPIAAGDPDATYAFRYDALTFLSAASQGAIDASAPVTLYSAALHMHLHGTKATLAVERASGDEECMLTIPQWNFHWQGSYAFAQPKRVAPGDALRIECHWDNSAAHQVPDANGNVPPPAPLNWGEGSTDEMCLGFVYVTQ